MLLRTDVRDARGHQPNLSNSMGPVEDTWILTASLIRCDSRHVAVSLWAPRFHLPLRASFLGFNSPKADAQLLGGPQLMGTWRL